MDTFFFILPFLFGIIIGSFLNVVALRFRTGMGLNGRSKCMSCGKELVWSELIPLFSFIFQRGRCHKCKSKISWQYPLVEFFSGAIFVLIFLKFPPLSGVSAIVTLIQILAACLLLVIMIYDIKHKVIPDSFVWAFDFLALISLFIGGSSWWHVPNYESLIAGPLLAAPFALLWLVSKGKWMGLGDAKLIVGIGWFLGIEAGINAIVLAFWIGAAVSVVWLLSVYKKLKPRMEIPFGPYLVLGMYVVLLFGVQVIDVGLLRYLL
ncbi:MAG: prepilin peptidase [Candidatus Taylorbacteria bacterium]|nr:prepilin peptidase [Candidatus Taylorbacteria bacterium]